ncbi:MAG: phosphodiester glycosidase family protein, partial [Armatimonadota bacterium]
MLKLREYPHFAVVMVLVALFALSSVAFAQASPVGYRVEFVNGIGVHVVQVNMGSPSVKVTPVLSKRYPGGVEPLTTICAREKPVAAITGTYFSHASLLPIGDIMIDGRLVHFGGMGSALAITPDNGVEFRRIPWGRQQEWGPYETVMAAGPMLLEDGEVALAPAHEKFRDPRVLGRAARAAVGITSKNKLLMVTTRQSISLWQLAGVMRGLDCTHAINLDGGSSTGLYYRGSAIVRPSRSLVNLLAVYVDVDPATRICQADR